MSVLLEAKKIVDHAACEVCGDRVEGAEDQIRERLRSDPTLASNPDVRWRITCGPCAALGKCPCCVQPPKG